MRDSMIRLVHILTSFDIGGAEQFVLDLCRRLNRKRFDITVVAVVRGGPLRPEFHEAGISTEVIGKATWLGLATIRRLTAFLQALHPTIVHTHLFGGDTWGRIAAIRAGHRLPDGRWSPHLIATEHNINRDEGWTKRSVKRLLARRTDRTIAVSEAVLHHSLRVDRIPMDRAVVIPDGVDLDRFHAAPHTPHEGVRFLTVARCVPQKGLDVLLDAFAMLRDALPNPTLTIVGDGPLRPQLEAHVRAYHLSDRVSFLGFRRDLPDVYHHADIAVFPSRWEGLGMAAIEAAASGLPVIASSVGGLREVVVDHETGILVPPEEPELLAAAMRELAGDTARRVLFGHAGRRHVERHFDIRRIVARYEELYEALVTR